MNTTQTPTRARLGFALFSLTLVAHCAIVGASLYQLSTEVPNWSANPARALVAFRQFFRHSHAGYFFQSFVPVSILCLLASTVLLWNRPKAANRWLLLALGGMVIVEVGTLVYFLPRNFILFLDPIENVPAETLLTAAREWQTANYIRLAMVLANVLTFLKAYRVLSIHRHQMAVARPAPSSMPSAVRLATGLLLLLSLASCKKEVDQVTPEGPGQTPTEIPAPVGAVTPVATPEGELVTATIGPAGGTLESADKRLRVVIPAGALTGSQPVSVQPLAKNHCPLGRGQAFRLLPHGLTFAKPAAITFQYSEQDVNGSAPQLLRVAYQTDKGHWQSPGTKSIDTSAHTVTVQTTHFSDWGLFQTMEITPNQAFVSPGEEVQLNVLVIPVKDYGDELLVPIPYRAPEKYIKDWVLRGEGLLVSSGNQGAYYAPKTIPALNPEAVTVYLNQSITIDGQEFRDLRLVANFFVAPEGLTFRINGGKWIHTLATARVIGQGGVGYLDMTGGITAEGNNWGVSLHILQIPPETKGEQVTTTAGMSMPWTVDPTSPLFHLTDEQGDVYYKHFYPVGRVFHPSPGALTFYHFGKVGDYAIGKFELQKAGGYNDIKGYIGNARVEGFFRMKRAM